MKSVSTVQQWWSTEKKVGENSIMQQLDDQLTARRYIDTQFVDYSFYKQSILNKTMNDSHAKRIRVLLISYAYLVHGATWC
jgi:hypothetical protein